MASGSLTRQGEQAVAEAEKELAKWSLFSSTEKNEKAADLYQRAGNAFKGARDWERAASAYEKAGDLQRKLGNELDSVNLIQNQAECMRNYDPVQAASLLEDVVVASMATAGRFSQAARLLEKTAESLEKAGKQVKAMELYAQAAEYHFGESASAAGNRCRNNSAMIKAKIALGTEDEGERATLLNEAIDSLVEVGTACLDSSLTKFSAKGHFLNAGLLILATDDAVRAERCVDTFNDLDYTFAASSEGKFLAALTEAVSAHNVQVFTNTVFQYDQIKKLDPWKTTVLLTMKRSMGEGSSPPPSTAQSATAASTDPSSTGADESAPVEVTVKTAEAEPVTQDKAESGDEGDDGLGGLL